MSSASLKVVPIGNSRGVRLPAPLLARYRVKHRLLVEERPEGILLKPVNDTRLTWEETARAMADARAGEEFGDWERAAATDGLAQLDQ